MVNIKPILDKLGVDIGYKTAHTKTITETDINRFAELSGDLVPVHVNEAYAKKLSLVGRIITHRVLSLGLICAAVARLLGLVIFLGDTNKFLSSLEDWGHYNLLQEHTSIPCQTLLKLSVQSQGCSPQKGFTFNGTEGVRYA